jgi:hypothetical protein
MIPVVRLGLPNQPFRARVIDCRFRVLLSKGNDVRHGDILMKQVALLRR